MKQYDRETYWTRVGTSIKAREAGRVLAGDSDPFHAYKRRLMLRRFLARLDVRGRAVLEVGCGPGGNLEFLRDARPSRLVGVDISFAMLDLAKDRLGAAAELLKTDGRTLPLPDASMDVVFTVTVLQHNPEPEHFHGLVAELCRVSRGAVVAIEDTAHTPIPADNGVVRPVSAYAEAFAGEGYRLVAHEALPIRLSRFGHLQLSRFMSLDHHEGQPIHRAVTATLQAWLAVSSRLDPLLPESQGLTRMEFRRSH